MRCAHCLRRSKSAETRYQACRAASQVLARSPFLRACVRNGMPKPRRVRCVLACLPSHGTRLKPLTVRPCRRSFSATATTSGPSVKQTHRQLASVHAAPSLTHPPNFVLKCARATAGRAATTLLFRMCCVLYAAAAAVAAPQTSASFLPPHGLARAQVACRMRCLL